MQRGNLALLWVNLLGQGSSKQDIIKLGSTVGYALVVIFIIIDVLPVKTRVAEKSIYSLMSKRRYIDHSELL